MLLNFQGGGEGWGGGKRVEEGREEERREGGREKGKVSLSKPHIQSILQVPLHVQ